MALEKPWRALAPGLLVALPALPWLAQAAHRASWAALGRDQGIFQFEAWAVGNGAVMYRDIRDVNGPLVLLVHTVFQALGGMDEHVFRMLDLVLTFGTAAFAGACLIALDPRGTRVRAAALALAACAVAGTQYLEYGYWETAQRESFFDAFVLVSMGLQMIASARAKRSLALFALAGALSCMTWLGKPTYVFVTSGQLLALAIDPPPRLRRLASFLGGGALGALAPLAFLAPRGDLAAWARITFHDIPAMYRWIWPRTLAGMFAQHRESLILAFVTSFGILALAFAGRMPRRALPLATLPLAGLASAILQAKGFPYHFHPVSLGAHLALVALAHRAWIEAESDAPRISTYAIAAAFAIALGGRTGWAAARAATYYLPVPSSAEDAASDERLRAYTRIDFFPVAMRHAAELLASTTPPDAAVQSYGMDPYVLFLARRRTATPYIYAYDLDADAALAGSWEPGGPHPSPAQQEVIRAIRDEHERDLVARLERAPPAAFVFIGRAPLMVHGDALRDFEEHCPDAAAWMLPKYREIATFDDVRVWSKQD